MSSVYFVIISLVVGFGSSLSFFAVASQYLKNIYLILTPVNKREEIDKGISKWWDSTISKNPITLFKLTLESVIRAFVKDNKPDLIKVLFFSYFFTLAALGVGYFFSTIGNYLSIYWHFPVNVVDNMQLHNGNGTLSTDVKAIKEFRDNFLMSEKTDFFANMVYMCKNRVN